MNHNSMKEYQQTNRKVCFVSENDTILLIESRVEYSENEKEQCWYSAEDMFTIQDRCIHDPYERQLCSRGLEKFTTEDVESESDAIDECINAVLDEQDIQWSNKHDDYDRLAIISQEASKWSKIEAIERALRDEKEARKIYMLVLGEEQNLSPPRMPIRQVSEINLSLSLDEEPIFDSIEPQKRISFMSEQKDLALVEQDPKVFAAHGRSRQDSIFMWILAHAAYRTLVVCPRIVVALLPSR